VARNLQVIRGSRGGIRPSRARMCYLWVGLGLLADLYPRVYREEAAVR